MNGESYLEACWRKGWETYGQKYHPNPHSMQYDPNKRKKELDRQFDYECWETAMCVIAEGGHFW